MFNQIILAGVGGINPYVFAVPALIALIAILVIVIMKRKK